MDGLPDPDKPAIGRYTRRIDPIRNPYTPGAGSRPPALTGRDEEIEAFRILLARLKLGRPEKSMLITGLRGVGKTVLLNTFEAIKLEALIAALHQVSQRELPLTLAGAGLPQLPALTGAAKSYAERLFRFPTIDRLGEQAARDALELPAQAEGVDFERAATSRILKLTEGYPYFLQEYGKHVWNVAAGPTIAVADVKRAHDLVQLELDESFFRVRIGRATKAELAYLAAMAHLGAGPYRSGEIAAKLGRPGPESVAPTRARLIEKGLIFSPAYGLNEFTVPQFDDFIRRSFPPDEPR